MFLLELYRLVDGSRIILMRYEVTINYVRGVK